MARNIADISGTSNSSPQSCKPSNASARIEAPVPMTTAPRTIPVTVSDHTRKPYSNVNVIQITWNGIVSHDGQLIIVARQTTASAPQAVSTLLGGHAIAGIPHRLDRLGRAELLP